MSEDLPDIKPCPFCGWEEVNVYKSFRGDSGWWWVRCDACWSTGPRYCTVLDATLSWNVASSPDDYRTRVESLHRNLKAVTKERDELRLQTPTKQPSNYEMTCQ